MIRIILCLSVFVSLFQSLNIVLASPNDFSIQSDGLSDLLIVEPGDRQLRWRLFASENEFSNLTGLGTFGSKTATALPGHWLSTGVATRAVVNNNSNGTFIIRALDAAGNTQSAEFSGSVAQILAGFDQNSNGIFDLAIRKTNGNFTLVYDPLTGASQQEVVFPALAKNKGLPIFANVTGNSDSVGYIYRNRQDKKSAAGISLMLRSLDGSFFKSRLKRVRSRSYRTILPIAGPDGQDRLLFSWTGSDRLNFEVRTLTGRRDFRGLLEAEGQEITIGNYLADAGEEFAIRTSSGIIVLNPFSATQSFVAFEGDGVVSDHILVARNAKSWTGASTSNEGIASVCSEIKGFSPGVLWKPASQDSGGTRQGKPVALYQDQYTPNLDAVNVYAINGEVVTQFGVYQRGSYERYYSGYGVGEGKSASQIASEAKAKAGGSKIYLQGRGSVCFGPIEPTQRNGALK